MSRVGGGRSRGDRAFLARALALLTRAQRSRFPISIRVRALGIYSFGVLVSHLTAAYVGSFFVVLALLLTLLPAASLAAVLLAGARLRYTQHFSSEHPVKGQVIEYRCVIENGSALAIPSLRAMFHAISPVASETRTARSRSLEPSANAPIELTTFLPGRQEIDRTQDVQLRYRGTYTLGLDAVELGDALQLFKLRPRIKKREFRVYPRILPLQQFAPGSDRRASTSEVGDAGLIPDYSLFNHLREYRAGESIRHLAWCKFASTGVPVVREYDATIEPAVLIYVDLRTVPATAADLLATEDVSVEALVALVNRFLLENIPVTVRASDGAYEFVGDHRADFTRFYESTFDLKFSAPMSAAALYRLHMETGLAANANSVFFITHVLDPEILSLLEEQHGGLQVTLIYNQTATDPALGAQSVERRHFNRLRESGTHLIQLRTANSIAKDLQRDADEVA